MAKEGHKNIKKHTLMQWSRRDKTIQTILFGKMAETGHKKIFTNALTQAGLKCIKDFRFNVVLIFI